MTLHPLRILDFSWVLAGPFATRILADFGAEVIKVQPLLPEAEDAFSRGYYNAWNRNKLGVTLDLNHPEGIALAKRLAAVSDAVVENFAPRVMANWGLDYLNVQKIKPDIIMLSMSLMGQSGPQRNYTGFGPTVHALSGMTHLTAYPGGPLGLGFSYADHVAGMYGCLALLGALEHRRKTGEGQHIDLSQVEAMSTLLGDAFMEYSVSGKEPQPVGNKSSEAAPYGVYRCLGIDRWCAIAVYTEDEWQGFKNALGNPPWSRERRFATLSGRLKNADELDRLVEEWTLQHSAEEVMEVLQRNGVAAGVVQDASDLARDPQLKSRGFFIQMEHSEMGLTTSDASPIRLSETPARYNRAAPLKGRDNDYVYRELLGMSEEEIAGLRKKKVI